MAREGQAEEPPSKRSRSDVDVVCLEYSDLAAGKDLTSDIRKAYGPGGAGILYVRGVPGLEEAREALLPLSRRLALLPKEVLQRYECEKAFYCVGWSHGKEKFRGKPDVAKGSFYANPLYDDPAEGNETLRAKYPIASKNVWPSELPELELAFKRMGRIVYDVAKPIVQQIDRVVAETCPGHSTELYDRTFAESKLVVARLLHYYAVTAAEGMGDWCGWHNDNSTITGLVPAMWLEEDTGLAAKAPSGAGLVVEGRGGELAPISAPKDCLGFQIGEAAQILSGGVVHATPHMVRGHISQPGEPKICRETFACFIQPQWDGMVGPPSGVKYDDIFKGREESELIPPLRSRLKEVPIAFGDYMAESVSVYYSHNNTDAA